MINVYGYRWYVCISTITYIPWDTAVGLFFVTDTTCYRPSGHVFCEARPIFLSMDIHNVLCYFVSFRVTCWMFTIVWFPYFVLFTFALPALHQLQRLSQFNRVQFNCDFFFLIWLAQQMLHPITGPVIFRVLSYFYSVVEAGLVLSLKFILPYKIFWLFC